MSEVSKMSNNKGIEEVIRIAEDNILGLSMVEKPKVSIDKDDLIKCFTKIIILLTNEGEGVEVDWNDLDEGVYICPKCESYHQGAEDPKYCVECGVKLKWPQQK